MDSQNAPDIPVLLTSAFVRIHWVRCVAEQNIHDRTRNLVHLTSKSVASCANNLDDET